MHLPGLHNMSPTDVLKESASDFSRDDMGTYAAALAYQVLFSLFPFILFLIALLGFLNLTSFFDWLQSRAEMMLPQDASTQVNDVISGLQQQKTGLMSFGAIVALWTASAAVRVVMNAMNKAYEVKEARAAWKRFPLSILYTIGLAAIMIVVAALLILGPRLMEWISGHVGLDQAFITVWTWIRWPVAVLLLMLVISIIYYVAPNIRQPFRFITPGAVFAVLIWLLASLAFRYYVTNFGNYNAMYGSVGAVIVLLFYFYISAAVLLFGAEVNAVVERHVHGKPQQSET